MFFSLFQIRIELCLSDQTVTQPGFNVKLKMEKETLSQFLNVAKTGYIIQLKDVKVSTVTDLKT